MKKTRRKKRKTRETKALQYGNAEHDREHKDGDQIQQKEENSDEHTSLLPNRMAQVESYMCRSGPKNRITYSLNSHLFVVER